MYKIRINNWNLIIENIKPKAETYKDVDENGNELKKVLHDFHWDADIRDKISRHPQVKNRALQYIFFIEMEKRIYMPRYWALRINFCKLVVHIFGSSYFGRPTYNLADLYDNSRTAFNCLFKFISRSKISKRLFRLISKSKVEPLKIAVLKNPRLKRDYFFEYQHTTNRDYINALAENMNTPVQVLNNIVKNADGENLELILKHTGATVFTGELIDRRQQEQKEQDA